MKVLADLELKQLNVARHIKVDIYIVNFAIDLHP